MLLLDGFPHRATAWRIGEKEAVNLELVVDPKYEAWV